MSAPGFPENYSNYVPKSGDILEQYSGTPEFMKIRDEIRDLIANGTPRKLLKFILSFYSPTDRRKFPEGNLVTIAKNIHLAIKDYSHEPNNALYKAFVDHLSLGWDEHFYIVVSLMDINIVSRIVRRYDGREKASGFPDMVDRVVIYAGNAHINGVLNIIESLQRDKWRLREVKAIQTDEKCSVVPMFDRFIDEGYLP